MRTVPSMVSVAAPVLSNTPANALSPIGPILVAGPNKTSMLERYTTEPQFPSDEVAGSRWRGRALCQLPCVRRTTLG